MLKGWGDESLGEAGGAVLNVIRVCKRVRSGQKDDSFLHVLNVESILSLNMFIAPIHCESMLLRRNAVKCFFESAKVCMAWCKSKSTRLGVWQVLLLHRQLIMYS